MPSLKGNWVTWSEIRPGGEASLFWALGLVVEWHDKKESVTSLKKNTSQLN